MPSVSRIALVLLILGFGLDAASVFTTAFSRRFGKTGGELASFVLRDVLGIPLWVVGLGFAVRSQSTPVFHVSSATSAVGWLLLGAGVTEAKSDRRAGGRSGDCLGCGSGTA